MKHVTIRSFDDYLLQQAQRLGAQLIPNRVTAIGKRDGGIYAQTDDGQEQAYDLAAVATGINASAIKFLDDVAAAYKPPAKLKTYISEACFFGRDMVKRHLGSSMHVFLLNLPRLEFAAIIPKGEYATVCLLGADIDKELVSSFFHAPEVQRCFPAGWQQSGDYCHCSPKINVHPAHTPFDDGIVFIGDCGATRLYKDGIGAAYRTAKAAAATAALHGIAKQDFQRHYQPVCQAIDRDNQLGRMVFAVTRIIQRFKFLRRGLRRMVQLEQQRQSGRQRMSEVLWNTFTGSALYREILLDTLHPAFFSAFLWNILVANLGPQKNSTS